MHGQHNIKLCINVSHPNVSPAHISSRSTHKIPKRINPVTRFNWTPM